MTTKGFMIKHNAVGTRVELPTFSDQWIRGARHGTVRSVFQHSNGKLIYAVKCDHPQIRRLYRHFAENFTVR